MRELRQFGSLDRNVLAIRHRGGSRASADNREDMLPPKHTERMTPSIGAVVGCHDPNVVSTSNPVSVRPVVENCFRQRYRAHPCIREFSVCLKARRIFFVGNCVTIRRQCSRFVLSPHYNDVGYRFLEDRLHPFESGR